jgi:hypothetical protein
MDRRVLAGPADRRLAADLVCVHRDPRRRMQRDARRTARADTGTRSVLAVRFAVLVR